VYYTTLCAHVKTRGTERLRVWTTELGYFASTSLLQARVAERELVTLASQQAAYDGNRLRATPPCWCSSPWPAWRGGGRASRSTTRVACLQ
jgi:hypothetical protein